jgi:uncharacterized protein YdeI (BOF family)
MQKEHLHRMTVIAAILCMTSVAVQAAGIVYDETTIKEITDGNSTFLGKAVEVEGNITQECPGRGCWFILDDGTGSILVDLKPNNFTMPMNLDGSWAKVYGNVSAVAGKKRLTFEPGSPYIIGKKVEITGEFKSPLVVQG